MNKVSAGTLLITVVLVSLVGLGCARSSNADRPATYAVTGTVTHNGQPVEGATVGFQPSGTSASAVGKTDADGNYTLTTFAADDGAIAGEYRVRIFKFENAASASAAEGSSDYVPPVEGENPAAPKNLLPTIYADPATSGLTATVTEDPSKNTFDFALQGKAN